MIMVIINLSKILINCSLNLFNCQTESNSNNVTTLNRTINYRVEFEVGTIQVLALELVSTV